MIPQDLQKQQQQLISSYKHHQPNLHLPTWTQPANLGYANLQQQQHRTFSSACPPPPIIFAATTTGGGQEQNRISHRHHPSMLEEFQQHSVRRNDFVSPPQLLQQPQFHSTIHQNKNNTGLPYPPPQQNGAMINQQKSRQEWAYEKLQSTWNKQLLDLDNIYNIVFGSSSRSQNSELTKKFQAIRAYADDTSKALRLSWAQFETFSPDQTRKIIERVKTIKGVIDKFNNMQQQRFGSQSQLPQPQQQINRKFQTSGANKIINAAGSVAIPSYKDQCRSINLQTSRQTFEKQNMNQPIHQTLLNPEKPLMSLQRMSLQNVDSEPDSAFRKTPSLINSTTSPAISPLPGSVEHTQGPVENAQFLSSITTNENQASSETASPGIQEEEEHNADTDGSALVSRLLEVVKSMSNKALCATAEDIGSVMNETIGGAAFTSGMPNPGGRMKRHFDVISAPSEVTASEPRTKMRKVQQHNKALLLDEIKETNKRFVETALDIVSDSDFFIQQHNFIEGSTVVRCSYAPVGPASKLLPRFCAQLLVPADYPKSSPVLLIDDSSQEGDLTKKVNLRFSSSLGELSQPPSLKEIARKWDDCVRLVLTEFAVTTGGGCFSTKHGKWENCI